MEPFIREPSRKEEKRESEYHFGELQSLLYSIRSKIYNLLYSPLEGSDFEWSKKDIPQAVPATLKKCHQDLEYAKIELKNLASYTKLVKKETGGFRSKFVRSRRLPYKVVEEVSKKLESLENYAEKLYERSAELFKQQHTKPLEPEIKGIANGIGKLYNETSELSEKLQKARLERAEKYSRKKAVLLIILSLIILFIPLSRNLTAYTVLPQQFNIFFFIFALILGIIFVFLIFRSKKYSVNK